MNMPRPEFGCGILPGELSKLLDRVEPVPLRPLPGDFPLSANSLQRFAARIVLFEYDPRDESPQPLSDQLRAWRRENHLSPFAGYSQPVEFPDAPKVKVLAWTVENFLFRQGDQLPYQFISMDDYRRWVACEPHNKPRALYGNCYTPTGMYLPKTFIVVS